MGEMAMLCAGAFVAAAVSGVAGFGGALVLLPLLVRAVGVAEAVPLLTVAQLVGNLARAGLGARWIAWRPAGVFLAAAAPGAALGALGFVALPHGLAARLVGAAILGFLALRALGWRAFRPGRGLLLGGGAAVGVLSGLVGSAGPLGAAVFLALELPPLAYVASEAVTAIGMHAVKIAIYGWRLPLGPGFWPRAAALGVAMVAGTWAARRLVAHLPAAVFRRLVTLLLAALAAQMLAMG